MVGIKYCKPGSSLSAVYNFSVWLLFSLVFRICIERRPNANLSQENLEIALVDKKRNVSQTEISRRHKIPRITLQLFGKN